MRNQMRSVLKRRLAAFGYALRGGWTLWRTQTHAKVHAAATLLAGALGFFLELPVRDWLLVVMAVAMVWTAEAMNTAIEFLADEVSLERRERLKQAKDVAAFGVLAAAAGAAVIGACVFGPRLFAAIAS